MNLNTPSKRLTDLLSTYLEFDERQLKLGLWGGDLNIRDVNLKNDAFFPMLNSWKKKKKEYGNGHGHVHGNVNGNGNGRSERASASGFQTDARESSSVALNRQNFRESGSTISTTESIFVKSDSYRSSADIPHDNDGDGNDFDIASHLTKEALLDDEPSAASTLNLKLREGKIGNFRARVPWRKLLLGVNSGDSTINLELHDVVIRISLESCIAKELEQGMEGPRKKTLASYFRGLNDQSHDIFSELNRLNGEDSRWKQEMIRLAEQAMKDGEDLPTPGEFAKKREAFFAAERVNSDGNLADGNIADGSNSDDSDGEVTATFLERFVRSFASSLGWRVGRGLKATLQNIQIIIEQEGIEVGVMSESIDILEYSLEDESNAGESSESIDLENDSLMFDGSVQSEEPPLYGKRNSIYEGECIRKKMTISKCGLFLRSHAQYKHLQQESVPPILDDYIIQPANATVTMCLRRDNAHSMNVNLETMEEENSDEETVEVEGHPLNNDLPVEPTAINIDDKSPNPEPKRQRRGKRDKRKGTPEEETCSFLSIEDVTSIVDEMKDETVSKAISHESVVVDEENILHSHSSEGQFEDNRDSFHSSSIEESSLVLTKVYLDQIVIVATSSSLKMMNVFLKKVERIKSGRPCISIKHESEHHTSEKYETLSNRCIGFSVLRGLWRRVVLLKYLTLRGNSFDSNKHQRFRKQYIELYRRVHLNHTIFPPFANVGSSRLEDRENLRMMEDLLTVEQILLFREFAKKTPSHKIFTGIGEDFDAGGIDLLLSNHQFSEHEKGNGGLDVSNLSFSARQSKKHHATRSIGGASKRPSIRSRHRSSKSFAFMMNDSQSLKVPRHVRNQTLNMDTVGETLDDYIPSQRQELGDAMDLESYIDGRSFDDGSVIFRDHLQFDTRHQFDAAMQRNSQNFSAEETSSRAETASPKMRGSIVSSFSFKLQNFNIFLCQESEISHEEDISILTTLSSEESTMFDVEEEDEVYRSEVIQNSEKMVILGKSHKIILHCCLQGCNFFTKKEVGCAVKDKLFSVNGIACFVQDSKLFSSGYLKSSPLLEGNANKPRNVEELSSYAAPLEVHSSSPFFRGKLRSTYEGNNLTSSLLRVSISKVEGLLDLNNISDLVCFLNSCRATGTLGRKTCSVSTFDKARWDMTKLLNHKILPQKDIDIHADIGGLQLDVPVESDGLIINPKDSSISIKVQSLILRQNACLDKADPNNISTVHSILGDFPSDLFLNKLFTCEGLECTLGGVKLFEHLLHANILLSKSRFTHVSSRPDQSVVLFLSPISIIMTRAKMQMLAFVSNALHNASIKNASGTRSSKIDKMPLPRLSLLADRKQLRVQVMLQSLYVGIVSENIPKPSVPLLTLAVREIISDLLSLLVCFPPPFNFEAATEAKDIAADRLHAIGLTREEAEQSVQYAMDNCTNRLNVLEIGERTRMQEKMVIDTVGLSPPRKKVSEERDINDDDGKEDVISDLCENSVQDALRYIFELNPTEWVQVQWTKSLCINMPAGIRLDLEKYVYDWRMTGKMDSFQLNSGGGTTLLALLPKPNIDCNSHFSFADQGGESGVYFSMLQRDADCDLGCGGIPLYHFADDYYTQEATRKRALSREIHASIGLLKLLFSDKDTTHAIESITSLLYAFTVERKVTTPRVQRKSRKLPIDSTTVGFDVNDAHILFCSDEIQPFTKIILGSVAADIVSSKALIQSQKKLLISATSDTAEVFDLTPEGQVYNQIVTSRVNEDAQECPFQMTMTISSDTRNNPSELLIVFNQVRIILLRRFINEALQYFLSSDYGLGHFVSVYSSSPDPKGCIDVPRHRFSFQVYVVNSSVILPSSSESDELVALTSSKIVISNSFEITSWPDPVISRNETNDTMSMPEVVSPQSTPRGEDYDFRFVDSHSDSVVFDSSSINGSTFNPASFLRLTISLEDADIFTGIQLKKHEGETHCKDLFYLAQYIDIAKIKDGEKVFSGVRTLPEELFLKKKHLNELLSRKWEKITLSSVQVEVFADLLPTATRIIIQDQISYDRGGGDNQPFSLCSRMSQFYALLSMWYGNMQELPAMFPYDSNYILETVQVPPCPATWPEYGSEEYVNLLKVNGNEKLELALSISELRWVCSFDKSDFFAKKLGCAHMLDSMPKNIELRAHDLAVKVGFTPDRVMKVGCGSRTLQVRDLRTNKSAFGDALMVSDDMSKPLNKSLDMTWGLQRDMRSFSDKLDFPFELSVFMTPDKWCLVNVGIGEGNLCSHDLGFFWILLEYFSAYFQHAEFGNPFFDAEIEKNAFLKKRNVWKEPNADEKEEDCLNLDIRLWMDRPQLKIPSDPNDATSQKLVLKSCNGGIFYRYKTIGFGFSLQEIIATNMDILMLENSSLQLSKSLRDLKSSNRTATFLAKGLNLDINYEMHIKSNHANVSINIPSLESSDNSLSGIESSYLQVEPLMLPVPVVCKPSFRPSRHLNPRTCDITVSPEYMKLAMDLLYGFIGPYEDVGEQDDHSVVRETTLPQKELSFSIVSKLSGIRLVVCEPVLGLHLPIAVVCVSELLTTVSALKFDNSDESRNRDLQASVDTQFWIDYYKNGPTRSWEPLLEPYKCTVLYEKSSKRGQGISFNSECPLHVNISGAFLETLDFATGSLFNSIFKVLGKNNEIEPTMTKDIGEIRGASPRNCRNTKLMREEVTFPNGDALEIIHEHVSTLSSQDRVAFSLINMTGQKVRYHQQRSQERELRINYLEHLDITALSFPATHSVFRNLKVVEVSAETFEDSEIYDYQVDSSHFIDVQLPGMQWTKGICVDMTGKRFIHLEPRSDKVLRKVKNNWKLSNALSLLADVSFFEGGRQVSLTSPVEVVNKTCHKVELAIHSDPMHISKNKRQRKQSEGIAYQEDIDVSSFDCEVEEIHPDETFHVPIFLLDASLSAEGSNLGSLWLRPDEEDESSFLSTLQGQDLNNTNDTTVGFCSKPIQISHLVDDSLELFRDSSRTLDQDQSALSTGYQLSCPIIEQKEESVSPFCYCVEVKRSPIVAPFSGHGVDSSKIEQSVIEKIDNKNSAQGSYIGGSNFHETDNESLQSSAKKCMSPAKQISNDDIEKDMDNERRLHGPVAYSLVIHPPIVIENLLPESARYELMHASREQVIWWSDLKAGESVPVHTVGLDAPLLLLINVGYCRTPVGEGALIHHGSGKKNKYTQQYSRFPKVAVKNVDKVLNAMTRIGHSKEEKVATLIERVKAGDSEERANDRIIMSPSEKKRDLDSEKEVEFNSFENHEHEDDNNDSIAIQTEVARETSVTDSLGQRLTLCIDNKQGGGGQRHITISCPYWIVNTTEHALRYKQEKKSSLVSGSMASASRDGSKPVDYSKRFTPSLELRYGEGTIFPGKPGALARLQKDQNLDSYTSLLNKDIKLDVLANMAFMFNYGGSHAFGAQENISIQLVDPLWRSSRCSEWSGAFSLQSVGVSQIVGMHCIDGHQLEVAVTVNVAPGKLSNYTKIVRICPRYVLINQLSQPIRLWQDSSLANPSRVLNGSKGAFEHEREVQNWKYKSSREDNDSEFALSQYDFLFGSPPTLDLEPDTGMPIGTVAAASALYITTAAPNRLYPFHLPNTRVDRELRLDLGPNWNLSASFSADVIGDYVLKFSRVVDLRLLKHVDNRGAPRYKVKVPPDDATDEDMELWDGELGVWFETVQWNGRRKIIVKGAKRGKFSHNNTDIHVGDELVAIDGRMVLDMTFAEAMILIKKRLSEVSDICKTKKYRFIMRQPKKPKFLKRFDRSSSKDEEDSITTSSSNRDDHRGTLTLTFQTLEYRMKRVRDKALKRKRGRKPSEIKDGPSRSSVRDGLIPESPHRISRKDSKGQSLQNASNDIQAKVSLKLLNQSLFVFINDVTVTAPYRVENRCMRYIIYFRQRGCDNHPWNSLAPGESINYAWEEPMCQNRLEVRVGNKYSLSHREATKGKVLPFNLIETEDQGGFGASRAVKLDEVGFRDILPCPLSGPPKFTEDEKFRENSHLYCTVDTDGATRVLVVSDANALESREELTLMEKHRTTLTHQIEVENGKLQVLKGVKQLEEEQNKEKNAPLSSSLPTVQEDVEHEPLLTRESSNESVNEKNMIDGATNRFISEEELLSVANHGETNIIQRTHQLAIEVIEATGLITSSHSDVHIPCNPYCSIRLEDRSRKMRRNLFDDAKNVRRTYYIEKNTSPKWSGMKFVFDIPERASEDPSGFAVSVKVKSFRLVGKNRPLGRTEIHLRNLRTQKEVIGWFPLLSKTGRGNEFNPAGAGRARGSIKLRIQWVYNVSALLDYFILLSENRVNELEGNRNGINRQLARLYQAERVKRSIVDSNLFSNAPFLTSSIKPGTNEKMHTSEGNWTSTIKHNIRTAKLRTVWARQKPNESPDKRNVSEKTDQIIIPDFLQGCSSDSNLGGANSVMMLRSTSGSITGEDSSFPFSPRRGPALSEGNFMHSAFSNSPGLLEQIQTGSFMDGNMDTESRRDAIINTLYAARILNHKPESPFHQKHMQSNTIFATGGEILVSSKLSSRITSWVTAYEYLNDPVSLPFYSSFGTRQKKRQPIPPKNLSQADKLVYPPLVLPITAPAIMQKRNLYFQEKLFSCRELFDKAAQRSLMAVLNPGGWLKLRPITALHLPQGFSGMYIKIRYGSETCVTSTVDARMTPVWTDESAFCNEGEALGSDPSSAGEDFFERRDQDLEVKVERLKTSGYLQLSVVGTRLNSKVELGILQIPLANAISCCNEASENKGHSDVPGIYVRWFPLVDPKNTRGDGRLGHRPSEVEKTSDNLFPQYYTPCIKLAMWWEPDEPLDFNFDHNAYEQNVPSDVEARPVTTSETYFLSSIDSISAALIDSFKAKELLSLSSTDIDVRYANNKTVTQVCVAVGHLQVDHHAGKALEPVVLSPTPVANPQPTIQMLAIKDNTRGKSTIDSYKHIAFAVEEMDLRIEEIWVRDVWEMLYRVLRRHNATKRSLLKSAAGRKWSQPHTNMKSLPKGFSESDGSGITNEVLRAVQAAFVTTSSRKEKSKQIYIEKLFLGSVKFNVSYIKSQRSDRAISSSASYEIYEPTDDSFQGRRKHTSPYSASLNYDRAEVFRRWSELGHDEDWTSSVSQRTDNFPNIISAVFPAIRDAPIRVNAKVFDNVFEPFGEIIANLKHFYLKEMLYQLYKIIGSVEIIGNPVMVVNSFMKGAHDFVVLPFREFLRSPNDPSRFGVGIAKGTLSLFSQTLSGVFGFLSGVSALGGSAAAALSFDEQFKRWHKQQVDDHIRHMHGQFRPKGCQLVVTGVKRPVQDVIAGIAFAVSGVFVEPYKGAQLRGVKGLSRGIGIGTVGLVAKPLVGMFDAFTHISESIQDVARSANVLDKKLPPVKKIRLPYVFGMQKVLTSYNPVNAVCANLLQLFTMKDEKRSELKSREILVLSELLQLEPGVGMYIVVSTKRIVLFLVRHDKSEPPVKKWEIKMSNIVHLVSSVDNYLHNGVVLRITSNSHHQGVPRYSPSKAVSTRGVIDVENTSEMVGNSFEINYSRGHVSGNTSGGDVSENRKDSKNNPVQNVFGAFGGSRNTKKKDKITYAVYGEFQHRAELTRVHNAICCLTGQFDSICYTNGVGVPGKTDGFTSFGPLHFVEEDTKVAAPCSDSLTNLDFIPWIRNFNPDEIERRKNWTYSDELKISSELPGPEWIVAARAQAYFQPAPMPEIPSSLDKESLEVKEIAHELRSGFISYNQAMNSLQELSEAVLNQSADITQEETNFGTVENSMRRLEVFYDGAGEQVSPIVPPNENVETRLEHVEQMLQQLLKYGQPSIPLDNAETEIHTGPIPAPSAPHQLSPVRSSNRSVVSALTGPGDIRIFGNPTPPPTLHSENERLKREVQFLRQQLQTTSVLNDNDDNSRSEGGSNQTDPIAKRKRKRRFKIFRKA